MNAVLLAAALVSPLAPHPWNLKCEGLANPLGIQAPAPRLSWGPPQDRPDPGQSAYQVEVASSADRLERKPDLWDSGRVESTRATDVPYGGAAPSSGERFYWKVRTWDARGQPSGWSEIARWDAGLLSAADWKAKPISAAGLHPQGAAVYFRKSLVLESKLRRACLYVSANCPYEAHFDGECVGRDDAASGAASADSHYAVFDITGKVLAGVDVVAAVLKTEGHRGPAILLAQLELEYSNGRRATYGTDESWRVSSGPILECADGGQVYDARRELEHGGFTWDAQAYDDSRWTPVSLATGVRPPLQARSDFPDRLQDPVEATAVRAGKDGAWTFDFGREIEGWIRLRVAGKTGQALEIRYGDVGDRYIFGEDGLAAWEPSFTRRRFRSVSVSGLAARPALDAVEAIQIDGR